MLVPHTLSTATALPALSLTSTYLLLCGDMMGRKLLVLLLMPGQATLSVEEGTSMATVLVMYWWVLITKLLPVEL